MPGTPIPVLFYGGRDTEANVMQVSVGSVDNLVAYSPELKSNPVAPAGASGECIFKNVYLTMTHDMPVNVRLTPIVDFVALDGTGGQPDERLVITLPDLTPNRLTERFEMGLSLPFPLTGTEEFRNALRGAWFQLLVEALAPLGGVGDLIFDQVELDYDVVRESLVAEAP